MNKKSDFRNLSLFFLSTVAFSTLAPLAHAIEVDIKQGNGDNFQAITAPIQSTSTPAEIVDESQAAARVTVTNGLAPTTKVDGSIINYQLNKVEFCGAQVRNVLVPVEDPANPKGPKIAEYRDLTFTECKTFPAKIDHQQKATFYISAADFKTISDFGHGRADFRFADSQQWISQTSKCYEGAAEVDLNTTVFAFNVNHRYSLTYGCARE